MLSNLAVEPIAEAIRRIASERRSGDLQVRTGKVVKMAFFDDGALVFAASNLKSDRFGESLVAAGEISPEDFHRVSRLLKSGQYRRFGDALVEAGVLGNEQRQEALARWIEAIVVSLFALRSGVAVFEERRCPIPKSYAVPSVSLRHVLRAGIQSMKRSELIHLGLGPLDRPVVAGGGGAPGDAHSPEEAEVLQRAQVPVPILRLVAGPDGGVSMPHLKAAYGLVAAGLLEDVEEARRRHLERAEGARVEVERELARSEELDVVKWLELAPTATIDERRRALRERIATYETAAAEHPELATDLELLRKRAASALRLVEGAAAPSVVAAAPPPESAPIPAVPVPEPTAAASAMEVDHLLMEANIRMSVSDFANAVQSYAKLVELQPDVPAHRVRLAVAMARSPATAKQAEAEFAEALRLDPDNPDLHYQFGLYYKAMRVRSRSIAEFRQALTLDPRHKKAHMELQAASQKDSVLSSIRRLIE